MEYLLVCEGTTDKVILDAIAEQLGKLKGREVRINLAPAPDSTSSFPQGFGGVQAWCLEYSGRRPPKALGALPVRRKSWQSLLLYTDGIILQMDTDIAEQIGDVGRKFSPLLEDRKSFCSYAINEWLGEASGPQGIYKLLSTYSAETWILATHPPHDAVFTDLPAGFDYEDIPDPLERLQRLGYTLTRPSNGRKASKFYRGPANKVADNLLDVRARCLEMERFCAFIQQKMEV